MVEILVKKRLKKEKIDLNCKFSLNKGEVITIYGKLGSGNMKLLDIIEGKITADEKYIIDSDAKQELNVVTLEENLKYKNNKSIKTNIITTAGRKNRQFAEEVLEHLDLKRFEKQLPSSLSKKDFEKFTLAMCLVKSPDVLVLHKFYSTFSFDIEAQLKYFLTKCNMAVIAIIENFKNIPKLASKLLFIHEGEINKTILLK